MSVAPKDKPGGLIPKELGTDLKAIVKTPKQAWHFGFGYHPKPWTWRNPTCYDIEKGKQKMLHYLAWADGVSTAMTLVWLLFFLFHIKVDKDIPRFKGKSIFGGDPDTSYLASGVGTCLLSWGMSLFITYLDKKQKKKPWSNYLWIGVRFFTMMPLIVELVYVGHTIHVSRCSHDGPKTELVKKHCKKFMRPLIYEVVFLPLFLSIHLWCAWIMAAYCLFLHKHR